MGGVGPGHIFFAKSDTYVPPSWTHIVFTKSRTHIFRQVGHIYFSTQLVGNSLHTLIPQQHKCNTRNAFGKPFVHANWPGTEPGTKMGAWARGARGAEGGKAGFPLPSPPGTCQYDGLCDGDVLFGEVVLNFQNKKSLKPRFLSKQLILETKILSAHSRREEGVRC